MPRGKRHLGPVAMDVLDSIDRSVVDAPAIAEDCGLNYRATVLPCLRRLVRRRLLRVVEPVESRGYHGSRPRRYAMTALGVQVLDRARRAGRSPGVTFSGPRSYAHVPRRKKP